MLGTWINVIAIIIGGALGLVLGSRLPDRVKNTVISGMGLFVIAIGIKMFLETTNSIIPLGGLLIGALLGEWWKIEEGFSNLGAWLEQRFIPQREDGGQEKFLRGFLAASILFCSGPMAILGSIQGGLYSDHQMLIIKSILDGFIALSFASTMGVGVSFSALPVLAYQGVITMLAVQLKPLTTGVMLSEMTAVGGLVLMAVGISGVLNLAKIRVGSFIPALFTTPLLVYILQLLKVI
ncbi:MAG: DUF554 domain-containing protein [Anaerolinea sp.]|nr:DUF554 domain-containing protein [Anaerolinea sp.]